MAYSKEYDSFKTNDGQEIFLYRALDSNGQWSNKYDKHPIFCPECGVAELKFTSKTSNHCAFLSTMPIPPNPEHAEDCSHRYRTIGKQGAKEFYNVCTREQAMDKINACINLLKRRNFLMARGDDEATPHRPRLTFQRTRNGNIETRRLRTRSFYSIYRLDDDDLGFPIVLYGKVYLSVQELKSKQGNSFNVLKVMSVYRDRRLLQSIYLGSTTIDVEEEHIYLFSMVGIPEKYNNYINVHFYNRDYTLYGIEEPDN